MSQDSVVLIVDDNGANRAVYERVVREVPGAAPLYFTDPEAALAWVTEHRPLIAVLDYKMPKMDGLELIRRMRAIPNRRSVPVVMLTGVDDAGLTAEAQRLGVIEHLTKPVDRRKLQQHISHALKTREAQQSSP